MKRKYTKGPWIVGEKNNPKDDSHSLGIVAEGDFGWIIADMCSDLPNEIDQEANARLIAASPSMYEFIKEESLKGNKKAIDLLRTIDC